MTLGQSVHKLEEDFEQLKENWVLCKVLERQEFGPLIRRAFEPITFLKLAFDTDVNRISELKHLIDSQQEFRSLYNLELLSKSFDKRYCSSASEFNLMSNAFQNTYSFSQKLNYPSIAVNSLTRSLISYRVLSFLFFIMDRRYGVIEIGPGSGQFANLAMSDGLDYEGIEVSRNLWIYQNLFLKDRFPKKVNSSEMFKVHQWVDVVKKKNSLTYNPRKILVANHVLREMTPLALTIYLHKLDCFSRIPFIVCEGLGYPTYRQSVTILAKFGYVPIISKLTNELSVNIFVRQDLLQDFSFLKKKRHKIWIRSSVVEDFLNREDKIEMQDVFSLINSYARKANLLSEDEFHMLDARFFEHL